MSKDKLKGSQGAGATNYPRLMIDYRFRVRANEKNEMCFEYYDKAKEEKFIVTKPLTGIFIGAVNTLSSFAQDWGRNGGSYQSAYYLTNKDRIAIFDPSGKKVFVGNREAIDEWCLSAGIEKFKVKKQIILLNEKSIVIAIETNMIIFIDMFGSFDKELFTDYLMVLTPSEFDVETNPINLSKRSLEYLGPFAKKNKPKFAHIEKGSSLTDEMFDSYGGDEVVDMFVEWKKFTEEGVGMSDADDNNKTHGSGVGNDKIKDEGESAGMGDNSGEAEKEMNVDDDLPF